MINPNSNYPHLAIIACILALVNSVAFAFDTPAKQAYLLDYNTHAVLFNKNGYEQMPPSSMTKIMTIYVIFDNLKKGYINLDDTLPVSENAWKTGGTKMFVALNSNVSIRDLIRGVIVQSGNDASKVLAEGVYGDENAFAIHMNKYANKIGMLHTNFRNASGLPDEGHYSTARDITTLAAAIINDFPEYYNYFSEKEFTHNKIHQYNKNTLLGKKGVDGLKTGHTDAGGYGMVVSAEQDGRRLIAVVNGLENKIQRIQEADRLLNYGFNNFNNKKIALSYQELVSIDVWYGKKAHIGVVSPKDIEVTMPKNVLQRDLQTIKIIYETPIIAPIKQGQPIAKLVVMENNQEIFSEDLIAKEDVPEANFIEKIIQNITYMTQRVLLVNDYF